MRYLVAPSIWLTLGLISLVMPLRRSRPAFLNQRTPEQRQQVQAAETHGLQFVLSGVMGVFCLANAVRAVWVGRGFWWLWLLAAVAHLAALWSRSRVMDRYSAFSGEERRTPTRQERLRRRTVTTFVAVAALAFSVGQAVMPARDSAAAHGGRMELSLVLLVVAGLAAVAAGWSAVWAFKTRDQP